MVDGLIQGALSQALVDIRKTAAPRPAVCGDQVAREAPVALVYNGVSHAVMMATPLELAALALGFSLTEGILDSAAELYGCEVVMTDQGFSVEMGIASGRMAALRARRRSLAGRTGCGLCGAESLAQAVRPVATVAAPDISDDAVQRAVQQLPAFQPLQAATGATHAAAWCAPDGTLLRACEDVGRHNALDKLVGTVATTGQLGGEGFLLVSSRVSYELVHKSCAVGIGALVAVSAPTSLAIELAQQAVQLLIVFARAGRHVRYHQPVAPAPS
ncbi:MAG: formate dehydrogenase accessory sulfurtransferase FdhD, partial [Parahaliea sp.]